LNEADLVLRRRANGFTLTEAWSPPSRIPVHAHKELSITILLQGCFEERYLPIHAPHELHPGSLVVRPAGELHANHLGHDGGRTLSLELDAARLDAYGKDLRPRLTLTHRREPLFLDLGLALAQELRRTDEASTLALESLGLELLSRLVRIGAGESGAAPAWLARTRRAIEDRFREASLRVGDLAAVEGVHPVHLARVFRRRYGLSPGDYVRRLRLEWARRLVTEGREPLASIALECGFADQSHLARAFRRRFGVAPGRLRRAVRPEPGRDDDAATS
jgi:AraC family transcriptional regulator